MRAGLALVLLSCLAGCGVPEQLLRVTAKVETVDPGDGSEVDLRLESDEGASASGCGRFGSLELVHATVNQSFQFDLLRAQTIGPRGTPRCFRLNWRSRSMLTFGPLDHDVELPGFTVWPGGDPFAGDTARFVSPSFGFRPVPPSYLRRAVDEVDVLPTRHFVEVFDEGGVLAWRAFEDGVQLTTAFNALSGYVPGSRLEGGAGTARGGGFRIGRTYVTDTIGRPTELRFEYRLVTNTVRIVELPLFRPLSRGRPCAGFAEPCPFTDGDFRVVSAAGATRVDIDLGVTVAVRSILVRGVSTAVPAAALSIDVAPGDAPERFERILVPVNPQLFRDGVLEGSRMDLEVNTGRSVQYARISLLDAAMQPVPLVGLAEVSLFE